MLLTPCYLPHHVQEHMASKVIVYFLTCACVDFFATVLDRLPTARGLAITPLHGRMKQAAREAALASFANAPAGKSSLRLLRPRPLMSQQTQNSCKEQQQRLFRHV
jgi:superfamily II DNA/RNA helicase